MIFRTTASKRAPTSGFLREMTPLDQVKALLDHLDSWNLDLVSITKSADVWTVTLSGDVPDKELEHLKVERVLVA